MKPPPPGPATNGMVTPSALAVATAASIALPPCCSTSMPAWLAPRSMEATAPPEPTATGSFPAPAAARAPDGTGSSTTASADRADMAGKRRMGTSAWGRRGSGCPVRLLSSIRLKPTSAPKSQKIFVPNEPAFPPSDPFVPTLRGQVAATRPSRRHLSGQDGPGRH